ncbi:MAG: cellulase family glycosylhydrolase [Oscillospiraceae bacterium]|nr:cellulase family glycosylhydrolase [Oscillospiraceae bacterium]
MNFKPKGYLSRIVGAAAAAVLTLMPFSASAPSCSFDAGEVSADAVAVSKKTSDCDYSFKVGEKIDSDNQYILDLSDIASGSTISEILIEVSTSQASSQAMVAYGCHVAGYNEDDWFSDSGISSGNIIDFLYTVPQEVSSVFGKDFTSINIQYWWGSEDSVTVESVGVNVLGGTASTLKGDLNADKKINVADLVILQKYLLGSEELKNENAADYNNDSAVDLLDFILIRDKIIRAEADKPIITDESAIEFVKNIKIGWNLGNTLDTYGITKGLFPNGWITDPTIAQFETSWNNPITSKEMIDAVKAAGFNTVRVPVSWGEKMGNGPDYTVDPAWMSRVNEVVDYVIDNDMYCILNVHHDDYWMIPTAANYSKSEAQLDKLWEQIAENFRSYDEHLIFETMNEPRLVGDATEWMGGTSEARDCINKLNQSALDVIRGNGGNNEKRYVMMPTYAAANIPQTINDMVVPEDDKVIVSIHAYAPYSFALDPKGTAEWSGTAAEVNELDSNFKALYDKFISQNIPVVIGEFASLEKGNNTQDRIRWAETYTTLASKYGIPCVWWDNNAFSSADSNIGIFNRSTLKFEFPGIVEALMKGVAGR